MGASLGETRLREGNTKHSYFFEKSLRSTAASSDTGAKGLGALASSPKITDDLNRLSNCSTRWVAVPVRSQGDP